MNRIFIRFILTVAIVFASDFCFSQNKKNAPLSDSQKIVNYYNQSYDHAVDSLELCVLYGKKALSLAQSSNNKQGMAKSLHYMGYGYYYACKYTDALVLYQSALKVYHSSGEFLGLAGCYSDIGLVYYRLANYEKALVNYFKSLEGYALINDKQGVAIAQNNIGLVFQKQKDLPKALSYFKNAFNTFSEMHDYVNMGGPLSNMGLIYTDLGKIDTALVYYEKALEISLKAKDTVSIGIAYNNLGTAYFNKDDFKKALEYYNRALKVKKLVNDYSGLPITLNNIGNVYFKKGEFNQALEYYLKSLKMALEKGNQTVVRDNYLDLSELYEAKRQYSQALAYHKKYISLKDSLVNLDTKKEVAEIQARYDLKEKDKENEILRNYSDIQELKIARFQSNRNQLVVIIILTIMVFGFGFYFFRQRLKLKQIILQQKAEIALGESEAKYNDLTGLLPQMVFEINNKGTFVFINQAGLKYTGYSHLEFSNGINIKDIILLEDRFRFMEELKAFLNSNKPLMISSDFYALKKDGSVFPVILYYSSIANNESQITGLRGIMIDISERKEAELRILKKVIETEESERKKFAEDLHDGIGPILSSIILFLNESLSKEIDDEERFELLIKANEMTNEAVKETRILSNSLMPSVISDYGLIKALESIFSKMNNSKSVQINFKYNASSFYDKTKEIVLYRVILELTNNSIKHAHSNSIDVEMDFQSGKVILEYKDYGIGFDLNAVLNDHKKGIGINNIINRIRSVNGTCVFTTSPGKGFDAKIELKI